MQQIFLSIISTYKYIQDQLKYNHKSYHFIKIRSIQTIFNLYFRYYIYQLINYRKDKIILDSKITIKFNNINLQFNLKYYKIIIITIIRGLQIMLNLFLNDH
ncbi:hypothetical protein TTHERM_000647358 (macronuclear) [Tetrahymena thermophila SB210]|uniref:Uncharacterized protein n=1 Tax=Tetrahymena thermophila (strain SB210) TaxID=312017 RepID=W7WZR4_TETTS|nr:hypothetical protein TTHERM_000647358 [Tetrahymena thermophila SB210]EWS71092.1 hypothetical protein TTHERM_000647358 [Tetrahymena thermophila SB210]|eukprot:XP_012656391.1 hypothetical protein TTHERM_000647358 [Tetrahymena thermophila SB210]